MAEGSAVTEPPTGAAINRRDFLGLVGLGATAVATGGMLAGCSKAPSTSSGSATAGEKVKALLPNYKPTDLLKPDIPGIRPVADGFTNYPAASELVQAITEKPGSGGKTIKSLFPLWGTPPPGIPNNAYYEAMNTALGVAIDPSAQDGNQYGAKLSAILGARDVPDLLVVPNWEVDKQARFSDAVAALFEDLTPYLRGDKVDAYPMLAGIPTGAWEYSVWGGKLAAVPWPTEGPYAWMLFYRQDLSEKAGLAAPTTVEELHQWGKKMTDATKGVWAFGAIFDWMQQLFGAPQSFRKKGGGGLEHKYETPEFKAALEFTIKLYKDGLVHPDVAAGDGGNSKTLFAGGKMLMRMDGEGNWRETQAKESKVTPGFRIQPVAPFAAGSGEPVLWGSDKPVFWTFVKKGLGKERTREILRVLNYLAVPSGSKERELIEYGVEGKHFTRAADNSPIKTELGKKELSGAYPNLSGRPPAIFGSADAPDYVRQTVTYQNENLKYLEKDLFKGIKLELPANYAAANQPAEDKIQDILSGRRRVSELDAIVKEFMANGGDDGRDFLEKTLVDNDR